MSKSAARDLSEFRTFYQLPVGCDVRIAASAVRIYVLDVANREPCASAVKSALETWYRGSGATVEVTYSEDGELHAVVRVRWATPSLMRPPPWLSCRIDRVDTRGFVVDTTTVIGESPTFRR